MNEIPENLKSAMEEFVTQLTQMEQDSEVIATTKAYDDIFAKLEKAQEAGDQARERFEKRIEELGASIKAQVLELGASASHKGVEAKYRTGYTSETYPVKEVRKILLANPAILPAFNAISVVKEVEPSVRVSYQTPEGD